MGFYIQGPAKGKADHIIKSFGAIEVAKPKSFDSVPDDKALICVIDNGPFEAAGFCYDDKEFSVFTRVEDCRPKRWLILDREVAVKESGYGG